MNTLRKYAISVALGSVGAIALTSCSDSAEECGPFDTTESVQVVTSTGLRSVRVFMDDGSSQNNSMVQTDSETQASIDDIEIRVEMEFDATPLATSRSNISRSLLDWILPSAHACSPPFQRGDVQSLLQTIDIFSVADLGADYLAGESLNSLFSVTETALDDVFYGSAGPLDTIAMQNLDNGSLPMMLSFIVQRSDTIDLIPDASAEPNIHRFTVAVELENGMAFSMDSNDVSLPMYKRL